MSLKIRTLEGFLVAITPFWFICRKLERDNRRKLEEDRHEANLAEYRRCRIVRLRGGYLFGYNVDWYEEERKSALKATIRKSREELEKLEEKKS